MFALFNTPSVLLRYDAIDTAFCAQWRMCIDGWDRDTMHSILAPPPNNYHDATYFTQATHLYPHLVYKRDGPACKPWLDSCSDIKGTIWTRDANGLTATDWDIEEQRAVIRSCLNMSALCAIISDIPPATWQRSAYSCPLFFYYEGGGGVSRRPPLTVPPRADQTTRWITRSSDIEEMYFVKCNLYAHDERLYDLNIDLELSAASRTNVTPFHVQLRTKYASSL